MPHPRRTLHQAPPNRMPGLFLMTAAAVLAASTAYAQEWPQWGGRDDRNMVGEGRDLPESFDPLVPKSGDLLTAAPRQNVRWAVRLGSQTYGTPVVAGGRVYISTNNGAPRDPKYLGDRGVLMCFDEKTGRFLWQLNVSSSSGSFPQCGIASTPTVEGDRVYLVTSRSEVVCLDAKGLADGNDGPFTDEGRYYSKRASRKLGKGPDAPADAGRDVPGPADADVLWNFDLVRELGIYPHDAQSSAVLLHGKYAYVGTGNSTDNFRVLSPKAPSVAVLDKDTGALVAVDNAAIGPHIFHGQWSSPSLGVVNGRTLIFYGGGDGMCYAFDPEPEPGKDGKPGVLKEVWRFDCNPSEYRSRGGRPVAYNRSTGFGPSEIMATPVFHRNRVIVATGMEPGHDPGHGCLSCIDATGTGDISRSGAVWTYRDIARSLSTVSVADGLVYAADLAGVVHCLDFETGKCLWKYDAGREIWGSTLVADGKVYVGNTRGEVHVLAAGKEMKLISRFSVGRPCYASPVVANGTLYVATRTHLYAVQADRSAATAARPAEPPR